MPPAPLESDRNPRAQFVRLLDQFHDFLLAEKEKGNDTVCATAALAVSLSAPLPRQAVPAARPQPASPPRMDLFFVLSAPLKPDADDLLTRMIAAMGFDRSHASVAVGPASELAGRNPRAIVALGADAAKRLPGAATASVTRGVWSDYEGTPLMVTHHPAELVGALNLKKEAWADLQAVMAKLGKAPAARK
ncbi:MAG: hypothetical protein R6X19_01930 [Kiritimatiellia bacterium]